jgi:hypothetical protein
MGSVTKSLALQKEHQYQPSLRDYVDVADEVARLQKPADHPETEGPRLEGQLETNELDHARNHRR